MLKNFENWLLENKYSALTAADYMGRIERLCRKEEFTLAHLVENNPSFIFVFKMAFCNSCSVNLPWFNKI